MTEDPVHDHAGSESIRLDGEKIRLGGLRGFGEERTHSGRLQRHLEQSAQRRQ